MQVSYEKVLIMIYHEEQILIMMYHEKQRNDNSNLNQIVRECIRLNPYGAIGTNTDERLAVIGDGRARSSL